MLLKHPFHPRKNDTSGSGYFMNEGHVILRSTATSSPNLLISSHGERITHRVIGKKRQGNYIIRNWVEIDMQDIPFGLKVSFYAKPGKSSFIISHSHNMYNILHSRVPYEIVEAANEDKIHDYNLTPYFVPNILSDLKRYNDQCGNENKTDVLLVNDKVRFMDLMKQLHTEGLVGLTNEPHYKHVLCDFCRVDNSAPDTSIFQDIIEYVQYRFNK